MSIHPTSKKYIGVMAPTLLSFLSKSWSVIVTCVLGKGGKCHDWYFNKELLLWDTALGEVLVSDNSNLFPQKKIMGFLYKDEILVMSKLYAVRTQMKTWLFNRPSRNTKKYPKIWWGNRLKTAVQQINSISTVYLETEYTHTHTKILDLNTRK